MFWEESYDARRLPTAGAIEVNAVVKCIVGDTHGDKKEEDTNVSLTR